MSAVTASSPAADISTGHRENDVGPRPGTPPPQQIARVPEAPASQHPGHLSNKVVTGKTRDRPASMGTLSLTPAPAPADYIAKQNQYQQEWLELQPTIANLPPEEQDARRAALKRAVLGD